MFGEIYGTSTLAEKLAICKDNQDHQANRLHALMCNKCPEMAVLRIKLDSLGIEWRDDSSVIEESTYSSVTFRTKWVKGNEVVSVIWGYSCLQGEYTGLSYGYPNMLECWYLPNDTEPVPMTVGEILEVCT